MDRIEKACIDKGMRMTDQRRVVARVLSEERYTDEDETLFNAVVSSLESAGVSWTVAPELLRALDGRKSEAPGVCLSRLVQLVPALAIIELIASGSARTARMAESMFVIVLEAIAATRDHSDVALGSIKNAPADAVLGPFRGLAATGGRARVRRGGCG